MSKVLRAFPRTEGGQLVDVLHEGMSVGERAREKK